MNTNIEEQMEQDLLNKQKEMFQQTATATTVFGGSVTVTPISPIPGFQPLELFDTRPQEVKDVEMRIIDNNLKTALQLYTIKSMIKETPNDVELGAKIREYYYSDLV